MAPSSGLNFGPDLSSSFADELNGDDDVIKRLRQSNHVSAYGPGSVLQPQPPPVSENHPPPPHPPPHPATDLASYMWPSAAAPSNQPQQQHSPHHNKWSPGAGASGPPGSVKEEPKPNQHQQAGDMRQAAPESPQQEQFQYTSPTGEAAFPSVTSNSAAADLYDTSIMSQVQNYSPSLSSSLGERQTLSA